MQNPRGPPEVKGPKSTKFDSTNHILARHFDPIHLIWTKLSMNRLLDHTNKFAQEFISWGKFKMAARDQRSKIWLQKSHFGSAFGSCLSGLDIWPPVAILDFALNEKFLHMYVCRVHAKLSPNRMNGILMPSRNVICGVYFCRFWTFDLWQLSWILPQLINSSANLFVWSRSLFMPNFVQIRWTDQNA